MALLRLKAILGETGKSRSALYSDINNGLFTKGVHIGLKAVAWPDTEVQALVRARIAGYSDDQLRSLVDRLHLQRNNLRFEHRVATSESVSVD